MPRNVLELGRKDGPSESQGSREAEEGDGHQSRQEEDQLID